MKQSIQFRIALWIALCTLAATSPTRAQIVPDATLPNNSSVTSEDNTSIITGGTRAGSNLFHSFEQFSVPTGSAAYFNNALEIQNIISRVTGSSVSNIDGLISARGTANLFLLNPNGILFGPNASLTIDGSFLASTASSLNFADGTQFSATAHSTTPLLTVSVPLGLQFGGNAGNIQVKGNGQGIRSTSNLIDTTVGLRVQPNQTLALVGGNVALLGGTLKTAGGRIELGSVAGERGLVSLTPIDFGWALGYEGVPTFGDIQLSRVASVDASGAGGGDIQVRGRRVTIQDGSVIEASTLGASPGGTLAVRASDSVELIGESAISFSGLFAQVYPGATGAGGNLTVETGRLTVRNGAEVSTVTSDFGSAGTLAVRASDSVELIGTTADGHSSGLFTSVEQGATGTGGNLTIETGRLTVWNGAQVQATTWGMGQAGNLVVEARDSVELIRELENGSPTGIYTTVRPGATGSGGNLTIETGRLTVRNGAQIQAGTSGAGQGGILTINASNSVELSGALPTATPFSGSSGLFVSAEPAEATGNVGDLSITTGQLIVRNGAKISANNYGTGQGGTATVNVRQLIVRDGGLVRAGSFGEGPGGTLTVNASESVEVSGTGTIGTDRVNSTLFVSSEGSGKAGELTVQARSIKLDNQGSLRAETAAGEFGSIRLRSRDLILRRGSNITTNATNEATGGNITIDTDVLAALENSDISANAQQGSGGRVIIKTQGIFGTEFRDRLTAESDITATSDRGPEFSGIVEINTPDVDPSRGLVTLPTQLVDAPGLIASGCGATGRQGESEFVVTGRGGLPPNPSETLNSDTVWSDLRFLTKLPEALPISESATQPTNTTVGQLVEAQGWVINNKGEVVLTAQAPTVVPHTAWQTPASCGP